MHDFLAVQVADGLDEPNGHIDHTAHVQIPELADQLA